MKVNTKRAKLKEEMLNRHFAKDGVDGIIVSIDFSRGQDTSTLIVGKRNEKGVVDVCNALQGAEAEETYYSLVGEKAASEMRDIVSARRTIVNITGPMSKVFTTVDVIEDEVVGKPITFNGKNIGTITGLDKENDKFFGRVEKWVLTDPLVDKFMSFEIVKDGEGVKTDEG